MDNQITKIRGAIIAGMGLQNASNGSLALRDATKLAVKHAIAEYSGKDSPGKRESRTWCKK
ncbi:MAG: hypothetical protein HKL90_01900 [Elusimicrobia bacterium]|nr:hypothetical protein [Elusimicrobiota bacterium]